MSSESRLFIVDGMALLFRSYYAMGAARLTSPDGEPIGAVFGFLKVLIKIMREQRPSHFVVAWDLPGKTFRSDLYPEYKAHRKETPEDLIPQIKLIQKLLTEVGLPSFGVPGFEADDVVGTLATRYSQDAEIYIVSGDKDFMQLLNQRVKMCSLKKGDDYVILGDDAVRDYFGVDPHQVIDVLALRGDASDNVPGVRGIGEKKAAEIIREFGSLKDVYEKLDTVANLRNRNALEAGREQAFLSQRLVTIACDVPLPLGEADMRFDTESFLARPALREWVLCLGIRSLAASLPKRDDSGRPLLTEPQTSLFDEPITAQVASVEEFRGKPWGERRYRIALTHAELSTLCEKLTRWNDGPVAFDTETTGLDTIEDRPLGVSFSFTPDEAWYIPAHEVHLTEGKAEFSATDVWTHVGSALQQRQTPLVAHNLKFDAHMLANMGLALGDSQVFCSLVAAWVGLAGDGSLGLDALTWKHLGLTKIPTSDLIGKGTGRSSMLEVPLATLAEYAGEDVDAVQRLWPILHKKLIDLEAWNLFAQMEMPFLRVLLEMERAGVFVDTAMLERLGLSGRDRLIRCENEIHSLVGHSFNVGSPKQLGQVLFEEVRVHEVLGFKGKLTKTTLGFKTDAGVLEQFANHPLVEKVLEYRETAKLLNTYIDVLPRLIKPSTGRVHTEFHQVGTATGRLSSANPNLQNIPVRTEEGRLIRAAFRAPSESQVICAADYSQIELRVLAHLANDKTMIEAFVRGGDIHRETAARIHGRQPEDVSSSERAAAKAINFGIIYGMGPQRLAREQGITLAQAKDFIERYFATYAGVKEYIDKQRKLGAAGGITRTFFGRPRSLGESIRGNPRAVENMAVNSPIQGTAADIVKLGMNHLAHTLASKDFRTRMVLQVHDEIVLEGPAEEKAELEIAVREALEGAASFAVPLLVEIGFASNWLEAK